MSVHGGAQNAQKELWKALALYLSSESAGELRTIARHMANASSSSVFTFAMHGDIIKNKRHIMILS